MERHYNQIKKEEYAKNLAIKGHIDRAKEINNQKDYEPITKLIDIHPETEIHVDDINSVFEDISTDIDIINSSISIASLKFKNLLETTRERLNDIKKVLRTEKERKEDISILCNKYSNFSNVILLSDMNTENNLNFEKGAFSIRSSDYKNIAGEVLEITGNGYEGNKYVYKNENFLSNTNDSSNRKHLLDDSLITYYEYSRVTARNSDKEVFPLANFDSIMARCSILISAKDLINTMEITMETDDVIVESLSTSIDGENFIQSDIKDIAINNKKSRFDLKDYIFGSGILSFQDCRYVRITFRSTKNTSDSIAFLKKNDENTEELIKLPSARRSVIRINDIKLGKRIYEASGKLRLDNFIKDPVKSVAIFANEYMASNLEIRDSIKYTLNINGLDYEVIPINSQNNGKKIVRTTNYTIPAENVHYVNETIKNATLTISLKSTKQYSSPFISDLKILVGGE